MKRWHVGFVAGAFLVGMVMSALVSAHHKAGHESPAKGLPGKASETAVEETSENSPVFSASPTVN